MCKKQVSLALGISMLPITLLLLPITLPIVLGAAAYVKRSKV